MRKRTGNPESYIKLKYSSGMEEEIKIFSNKETMRICCQQTHPQRMVKKET